jgi:RNA polymerase sigma-70 factor (ECF subfamily)
MLDLDRHLPAIAAADPEAFGDWAGAAEAELRGSLRGFAAAVDVESVLQEALLRAWQLAPRLRPDGRPNALLRFALRAARNLAVDEARRRRRVVAEGDEALQRRLDALADASGGGPAASDPLLRRLIEYCRDKLPGKPRQALEARLAAAGGEPDQVIAARLGQRPNTFLQNFTRARRLLAECLKGRGVALDEVSP